MKNNRTKMLVICALFASLTALCAWIALPIGPVPISLATLAVMLCGQVLGWKYGVLSQAVYILLGLAGVPVFAGFRASSALMGPTAGYILGYLPCALVGGLSLPRLQKALWGRCLLLALGTLACYALGTVWFMHLTGRGLAESLSLCVLPFLPGDGAKIIVAALLSPRLRKALSSLRLF